MKLKNHAIKSYFSAGDYHRLESEAHIRETSLANAMRECVREYLALRQEIATAIKIPGQLGEEHNGRIIHTLLSRTEERIGDIIKPIEKRVSTIENKLDRLTVMLDQFFLLLMQHFPELPESKQQTAANAATKQRVTWHELIEQELQSPK